ncbi:MAG: GNAT family N-acetyltransferase [Cyclobacteriaceae bacterium]
MEKNVLFRLAEPTDVSALVKVGDRLFDNPVKPDRASEFLNDPRHHLVIALLNDEVVGMASGFHYIHPDKDPVLFIDEVGVVEEFQNRGIGRQLVKEICKHGESLGCQEAWVATDHTNTAARKAYVAAGGVEDRDSFLVIDFRL